jgi:hypothetical protein
MTAAEDLELLALIRALAAYLRANPLACDTPEGIRRWWLASETTAPQVQRALDWMRARRLLEALPAADGHTRYRLAGGADLDAALHANATGGA